MENRQKQNRKPGRDVHAAHAAACLYCILVVLYCAAREICTVWDGICLCSSFIFLPGPNRPNLFVLQSPTRSIALAHCDSPPFDFLSASFGLAFSRTLRISSWYPTSHSFDNKQPTNQYTCAAQLVAPPPSSRTSSQPIQSSPHGTRESTPMTAPDPDG